MKQNLVDFDLHFHDTKIFCDNTSAINISKNFVLHCRTKHIDVRHHFLRDHVKQKDISLVYIDTKSQLAHIFTKPLCEVDFCRIRNELGMCIL